MNENINLVEILKDAPKGTKLYSALHGEVTLVRISNYEYDEPITVKQKDGLLATFDKDGKILNDGECLLFPSKDQRDWSKFKVEKRKHFEPFQKVLIPDIMGNVYYWFANLYSHYNKKYRVYVLIDGQTIHDDEYIIPYEGNEDKLGKPVE